MSTEEEKNQQILEKLQEFVTEHRKNLFYDVIENRTHFLTIVLEDIFQAQNASAVLRTAECLGIQNIHVIENKNQYKLNPDVVLGADKWIDIHYYKKQDQNNSIACLTELKAQGYQIAVTMPHTNDTLLTNFNPKQKTAVVFGTEALGISEDVKKMADVFLKIPMFGFTESYNISVSAGIIMYDLIQKLKKSSISWRLTEQEKTKILLNWTRETVRKSSIIEKNLFK